MLRMSSSTSSAFLPCSARCAPCTASTASRSRSDISAGLRCSRNAACASVVSSESASRIANARCGRCQRPGRSPSCRCACSTIGSWQMPARRSIASITSSGPKSASDSSTTRQSASPSAAADRVAVLGHDRPHVAVERGEQLGAQRRRRHRDHEVAERPLAVAVELGDGAVDLVLRLQRLGDEADRAGLQRALARVVGRDDADRDVAGRDVGLEPVEDAPALHVGQRDVERDHRRMELARHRQRAGAGVADQALEAGDARRVEQRPWRRRGRSRPPAAPGRRCRWRRGRRRRRWRRSRLRRPIGCSPRRRARPSR